VCVHVEEAAAGKGVNRRPIPGPSAVRKFCDLHHSRDARAPLGSIHETPFGLEAFMTVTFMNWTSRVAIAGRVAEWRRQSRGGGEWIQGDYHLPFGQAQARAEAAKWLCQV
jgi:hypothetical protein